MGRGMPVGFRFHPTDQELIGHYLSTKTNPNSDPWVSNIDLYGEAEPWTIWEDHGGPLLDDEDLIFFTKLKKNKQGHRICRRIGSGTWSQGELPKPIFAKNNQETPIGKKTKLRYESKVVNGKARRRGPNPDRQFDTHDQEHLLLQGNTNAGHVDYALEQLQRDAVSEHQQQHTCSSSFAQPKTTVVDVFVSENAHSEGTDDCLGVPLEVAQGDTLFPALSEQQTSFMSQMQAIHSEENESGHARLEDTDWHGIELEAIPEWQQPAADQNALVISKLQVSTNDEEFSIACDDFNKLPMDDAYINSFEFSNYIFGDEFLSGGDGIGTADILQGSSSFSDLLEDQHHQV
ncbi:hypothetical protein ACLB2K_045647 [Fragaria x ananassa]